MQVVHTVGLAYSDYNLKKTLRKTLIENVFIETLKILVDDGQKVPTESFFLKMELDPYIQNIETD